MYMFAVRPNAAHSMSKAHTWTSDTARKHYSHVSCYCRHDMSDEAIVPRGSEVMLCAMVQSMAPGLITYRMRVNLRLAHVRREATA